jgi:hypothetical protein
MITKIKEGLKSFYYEQSLKTSTSAGPDPDNFITVNGSTWRPSGDGLVVPLPFDPKTNEIAWICFRPTLRAGPADGVILYEIHNIEKTRERQKIPDDLARRLAEAHARQRQASTWQPFAQNYVRANPQDAEFIRTLALTVGVAAAIAIITVAVIYAAPIVVAAAGETAVAVETTEVFVGGGYRVAPQLVRVAVEEGEIVDFAEEVVDAASKARMLVGK